jgi:hydrogenase maturation factor
VDTTILGAVRANDLILVHAGAAITRLEVNS